MALDHFDVTRATTKTVLNAQGVLETVPANVPGFEFNPDGTYKGCLIEPSATNLVTETFNDTPPEPLPLDPTNQYGARTVDEANNVAVSGLDVSKTYTARCFLYISDDFDYDIWRIVDDNGVSANADLSKRNEWQYLEATFTNSDRVRFRRDGSGTNQIVTTALVQVEEGSVPTSFIPVNGATATRNADVIVRENAQDLIGQEQGTVIIEVAWLAKSDQSAPTGFKLTSSANQFRGHSIGINNIGDISFFSRNAAAVSFANIITDYTLGTFIKIAFTYDYKGQAPNSLVTDGGKVFVNGSFVTDVDIRVPATGQELDIISLFGRVATPPADAMFSTVFKSLAIYKKVLSDNELEALTS